MQAAADYRRKATEFEKLARATPHRNLASHYRAIANSYRTLASDRERSLSQRREPT